MSVDYKIIPRDEVPALHKGSQMKYKDVYDAIFAVASHRNNCVKVKFESEKQAKSFRSLVYRRFELEPFTVQVSIRGNVVYVFAWEDMPNNRRAANEENA